MEIRSKIYLQSKKKKRIVPSHTRHGIRKTENTSSNHGCHIVESRVPPFRRSRGGDRKPLVDGLLLHRPPIPAPFSSRHLSTKKDKSRSFSTRSSTKLTRTTTSALKKINGDSTTYHPFLYERFHLKISQDFRNIQSAVFDFLNYGMFSQNLAKFFQLPNLTEKENHNVKNSNFLGINRFYT